MTNLTEDLHSITNQLSVYMVKIFPLGPLSMSITALICEAVDQIN